MEEKIVAHFMDGRTQRGYTHDFRPDVESFHLLPSEGGGIPTTVRLEDLKALFYVKDYGFMRRQVDRAKQFGDDPSPRPEDHRRIQGRREDLGGDRAVFGADSRGFFFIPADPGENNSRIFIVNSSVKQIQFED